MEQENMNPTNILFRMISNPFQRLLLFILTFCVFVGAVPHANALTTVSGSITTDTTWSLGGSPYIVTSSVTHSLPGCGLNYCPWGCC